MDLSPTSFDAFSRLRISNPLTLFDSKQIFDNLPLKFDETTTGAGSTSHSANAAATTLSVSGAGSVIRQSKQHMTYQPGKSLLILRTFAGMGQEAGVVKRYGYFDDANGVFLQVDDSGIKFVIRSNVTGTPVDTAVEQADWNGDRLDLTSASDSNDISLDTAKAQILWFDLEWLGVGTVRCGFVTDGKFRLCHTFYHANDISSVYMSTPNLPLRSEIISTGATGSFDEICSSVISEGGYDTTQSERTVDTGTTAIAVGANAYAPLISLRTKASRKGASFIPVSANLLCVSGATFRWAIIMNATFSAPLTYTALGDSVVDYSNTNASGIIVTAENYIIDSGYAELGGTGGAALQINRSFIKPGFDIAGNSDTLTLAVQKIGGGSDDFYASLKFVELY